MFESCGFRREAFYPCYGLAEATLLVSGGLKANPPVVRTFDAKSIDNGDVQIVPATDHNARRLVGSGQAFLDQKILIVYPEKRTRCPDGDVGEIWVSGLSVAQGYWRRREENEHTFGAAGRFGRRPLPAHRRLGFFPGRRIIRRRTAQGPDHYPWSEPLSARYSS